MAPAKSFLKPVHDFVKKKRTNHTTECGSRDIGDERLCRRSVGQAESGAPTSKKSLGFTVKADFCIHLIVFYGAHHNQTTKCTKLRCVLVPSANNGKESAVWV